MTLYRIETNSTRLLDDDAWCPFIESPDRSFLDGIFARCAVSVHGGVRLVNHGTGRVERFAWVGSGTYKEKA